MRKHYEFQGEYPGIVPYEKLSEWMDRERAFQDALPKNDPRHWEMFEFETDEDGSDWVNIFWGGPYGYPYELSRIERPEDLLWLIVHLSRKTWPNFSGFRVGRLIEAIAVKKGWPPYGDVPHPNESPKPDAGKIGERAKMTHELRYKVIRRDLHRCRSCGHSVETGAVLHVDHIVPIARGGRTEMKNLQTLCSSCNMGKSDT